MTEPHWTEEEERLAWAAWMKEADEIVRRPMKCEGCLQNWADPPSRLCPGCEAYSEHQA
jgi:hypothetical protein